MISFVRNHRGERPYHPDADVATDLLPARELRARWAEAGGLATRTTGESPLRTEIRRRRR